MGVLFLFMLALHGFRAIQIKFPFADKIAELETGCIILMFGMITAFLIASPQELEKQIDIAEQEIWIEWQEN